MRRTGRCYCLSSLQSSPGVPTPPVERAFGETHIVDFPAAWAVQFRCTSTLPALLMRRGVRSDLTPPGVGPGSNQIHSRSLCPDQPPGRSATHEPALTAVHGGQRRTDDPVPGALPAQRREPRPEGGQQRRRVALLQLQPRRRRRCLQLRWGHVQAPVVARGWVAHQHARPQGDVRRERARRAVQRAHLRGGGVRKLSTVTRRRPPPSPPARRHRTAINKLRIVTLRLAEGWQKVALERWTNLKPQRRTCSPRYGVPLCRRKSAGVA